MREIISAALRTGGGTIISLLFGSLSVKIMAAVTGPAGTGLYSLLKQSQQLITLIASCNVATPIVQGVAGRNDDEAREIVYTAFWFTAFCMLLVIGCTITAAPWLAPLVLGTTPQATGLFRWLSVPAGLAVAVSFVSALLNGRHMLSQLASLSIWSSFASALLAWPCAHLAHAGYASAFISLMSVTQLLGLLLGIRSLHKVGGLAYFNGVFSRSPLKHLEAGFMKMSASSLGASLVGMFAAFLVRVLVQHNAGLVETGRFDAAWALCMMYVMVILSSFGGYYLPRLSGAAHQEERLDIIHHVSRLALLLCVPFIMAVSAAKPLIIHLLYTDAYLPALSLMRWMLVGDFFRISNWVFAIPMIAVADMRCYLAVEILGSILLTVGTWLVWPLFGTSEVVGVVYILTNVIYFLLTFLYLVRHHGFKPGRQLSSLWLCGLGLVIAAAILCWTDIHFSVVHTVLLAALSAAYLWRNVSRQERAGAWLWTRRKLMEKWMH